MKSAIIRAAGTLAGAVVLGTAVTAATACGHQHPLPPGASSTVQAKAHAAISAMATSTAVAADKAQAQKDVTACVNTGHVHSAEACLRADVPPAKRHALETCMTKAAINGWAEFKHTGAQACVAAALQ